MTLNFAQETQPPSPFSPPPPPSFLLFLLGKEATGAKNAALSA